jgi:hypothetical protein
VTVVNTAGDFHTALSQGDVPVSGHGDIAAFPQLFHGNTDAGLGEPQFVHHVDGPDLAGLFLNNQDGLQVILCGFVYDQDNAPPFCLILP